MVGVRLDSGDLLRLSREVRRILDDAGFPAVRILVSGGLDEFDVERLVSAGAPIDAFGVGTRMNVSSDAPSVDLVYKLVQYGGRDVLKLSEGKETWVGAKAVYRLHDADVLALAEEPAPVEGAESLLQPVMRGGELLRPHPTPAEVRAHCLEQLALLPDGLRKLDRPEAHPVRASNALRVRQAAAVAAARDGRRASGST